MQQGLRSRDGEPEPGDVAAVVVADGIADGVQGVRAGDRVVAG